MATKMQSLSRPYQVFSSSFIALPLWASMNGSRQHPRVYCVLVIFFRPLVAIHIAKACESLAGWALPVLCLCLISAHEEEEERAASKKARGNSSCGEAALGGGRTKRLWREWDERYIIPPPSPFSSGGNQAFLRPPLLSKRVQRGKENGRCCSAVSIVVFFAECADILFLSPCFHTCTLHTPGPDVSFMYRNNFSIRSTHYCTVQIRLTARLCFDQACRPPSTTN